MPTRPQMETLFWYSGSSFQAWNPGYAGAEQVGCKWKGSVALPISAEQQQASLLKNVLPIEWNVFVSQQSK